MSIFRRPCMRWAAKLSSEDNRPFWCLLRERPPRHGRRNGRIQTSGILGMFQADVEMRPSAECGKLTIV